MARIAGYTNNYIFSNFISYGQVNLPGILNSYIYVPYANDTLNYYAAYNVTLYNLMFNSEVTESSYFVWARVRLMVYRPFGHLKVYPCLCREQTTP